MRDSNVTHPWRVLAGAGLIAILGTFQPALALNGPVGSPPLGVVIEDSETLPPGDPEYGEHWGREGGRTFGFTVFQVGDYDQLMWRPTTVNLAFDGEVTAGTDEILTYDRIEAGTAVWVGQAQIQVLNEGTGVYVWTTVDTEFRLTVTDEFDSVVPFTVMLDGLPYVNIKDSLPLDAFGAAFFEAKLEARAVMPSYGTTTAICPYTPPEPNVGLYYPALNVYDCLHTNPANPTPAISDFEYGFFYGLETLSLDEHDQHMEELVGDVQSTVDTIQTHTQFLFDDWPGVIGEFRGRHDQTQDGIASLAGTLGAHGNAISVVDDKVDDIASTLQSWSDPSGQLDQIQEQTADLPNALLLLLMFGVEADEVGLPPDPNLPGFEMVEQVSDLYQGLAALGEALDSHIAALMSQVEEKDQVIADLQSQLASMYTQEQVDAIVEITCPGNSESHGNP